MKLQLYYIVRKLARKSNHNKLILYTFKFDFKGKESIKFKVYL